jgi:hypothetical protein
MAPEIAKGKPVISTNFTVVDLSKVPVKVIKASETRPKGIHFDVFIKDAMKKKI